MLTSSGTPGLVAAAAAAAASGKGRLSSQGQDNRGVSTGAPVSLQQDTVIAVADSPDEEAEHHHTSRAQLSEAEAEAAVQTEAAGMGHMSSLGHSDSQEAEPKQRNLAGVTEDDSHAEAMEVADQLPLSYPATLVATLPCTMPAWLAHSQRTVASTVLPTQLVGSQAQQSHPAPTVHAATVKPPVQSPVAAAALTGQVQQLSASGPAAMIDIQGRPKCRLVTRLSQPSAAVHQDHVGMPEQAMGGFDTISRADVQHTHQGIADQARAGTVKGVGDLQQQGCSSGLSPAPAMAQVGQHTPICNSSTVAVVMVSGFPAIAV